MAEVMKILTLLLAILASVIASGAIYFWHAASVAHEISQELNDNSMLAFEQQNQQIAYYLAVTAVMLALPFACTSIAALKKAVLT